MHTVDVNKFLLSLSVAIASRSGLVFATADLTAPRSLWLHEITGSLATDPATVLRAYGGESPEGIVRKLTVSLQQMTRGKQSDLVLAQAWMVHQALLNDEGQPQTAWAIPGKQHHAVTMAIEVDPLQDWEVKLAMPRQTPGLLGRDEDGKWMASCNWDVEFLRRLKTA